MAIITEDPYVISFTSDIVNQEPSLDPTVIEKIVDRNHVGNGYFSWDGILDALAELVGADRASEIIGNC